jgi:hypothetical protein
MHNKEAKIVDLVGEHPQTKEKIKMRRGEYEWEVKLLREKRMRQIKLV